MSALTPDDARRMRGVLSRLLSDQDGERLAAVNALLTLLGRNGVSVVDLVPREGLASPMIPAVWNPKAARRAVHPGYGGKPRRVPPLREHQHTAWMLLASSYPWDEWQRGFLLDLKGRNGSLSPRQDAKLRECCRLAGAPMVSA